MNDNDKKSSFDKLVAGLDSEDRIAMLNRINQETNPSVPLVNSIPENEKNITLQMKYENETIIYRFVLWLRSLFVKDSPETIYSQDVISNIAKKINHRFPGTINHKIKSFDYIFYERLISIKEAADFFKPYFIYVQDNPGDFYVFLSSFVAPELAEKINSEADPFMLPFEKVVTPELRSEISKKLDDILNNMDRETKKNIYMAVVASSWLSQFSNIQFIHFLSQFTNIAGNVYTCPYKNGINDYNELASIFYELIPIPNEVLEAIFLFSQRKHLNENTQDKDIEKAVKDFLSKSNTYFTTIQSFANNVPIKQLGRVINNDFDWAPEKMLGVENWFPSFRSQWRKILEIRWNDWLREQKKQNLSENLKTDFGLTVFPTLAYRPWLKLWNRVPFACELTGGFLSWFCTEKYESIIEDLNLVAMEGIFYRSENRTEYSEGLNNFSQAYAMISELLRKLSPEGEFGRLFDDFAINKIQTMQVQNQINSMMSQVEQIIKDAIKLFGRGARTIERVFFGFFEEKKDGIHESLQNINTIKGHENRQFRESLMDIRVLLKKSLFYISELEPIDSITE